MRFRVTYIGATMTKRMRGRVVHGQKADVVDHFLNLSRGIKTDRGTIVCVASNVQLGIISRREILR